MTQSNVLVKSFGGSEDGGITPLSLYLCVGMFVMGGLAVDVSNLVATRTQLQISADFAAHAALYTREHTSASEAKSKALELVQFSFPTRSFGETLDDDDIVFGSYDSESQTFTADSGSTEAVYVRTNRMDASGNAVSSFLLQFAGFPEWDVITPSVFETYRPGCLRDGWVAEGVVDSQSNNTFSDGFCIHSNAHVEVNNNNVFYSGVTITMPDLGDLVMPGSGFTQNSGLEEALSEEFINLRILNQLPYILDGLYDTSSEHFRDYVNSTNVVTLSGSSFDTTDFIKGRIHEIDCGSLGGSGGNGNGNGNGNGGSGSTTKITIDASSNTLSEVVVVTDCDIKFSNNSVLEDVVVFTTNTTERNA